MKYAIFLATIETDSSGRPIQAWQSFQNTTECIKLRRLDMEDMTKKYSDTLWLLALQTNTHYLGELIASAERFCVPYTVLYLQEAPTLFEGPTK